MSNSIFLKRNAYALSHFQSIIEICSQVITSVSYYPQQRGPGMTSTTSTVAVTSAATASNANVGSNVGVDEEDFLTAERMAAWLKENRVLQVCRSLIE